MLLCRIGAQERTSPVQNLSIEVPKEGPCDVGQTALPGQFVARLCFYAQRIRITEERTIQFRICRLVPKEGTHWDRRGTDNPVQNLSILVPKEGPCDVGQTA